MDTQFHQHSTSTSTPTTSTTPTTRIKYRDIQTQVPSPKSAPETNNPSRKTPTMRRHNRNSYVVAASTPGLSYHHRCGCCTRRRRTPLIVLAYRYIADKRAERKEAALLREKAVVAQPMEQGVVLPSAAVRGWVRRRMSRWVWRMEAKGWRRRRFSLE
ncbi:hypothetical protein K402DRAFT_398512 [Aulographum hederae CBS 113979]|uniref:Uncharacterized protein n=1 Tax=Aulographum hederae CBS 113979 TaxID=1176131 RepID=A0A6G1GKD8_9PEZI|nr:hypothetical protein K402DRAFT_398512 [Aulographum hederae CBS 113979]